jgi:hypothetical protein
MRGIVAHDEGLLPELVQQRPATLDIGHENRRGWQDSAKFPVNFPVSREFGAETGSQQTASSARLLAACFSILMDEPECGALVGPGERNALEPEPDG